MFRRAIYVLLLIAVYTGLFPGYAGAQAQQPAAGYTFQECDTLDQSALRDELNKLAQRSMDEAAIDLDAIVERRWHELNINAVIDGEIDKAVVRVKRGEEYLDRLLSGWSPDKANELATKVADQAFDAPAFRSAIDELSNAIAADAVAAIETASSRSASSALACMQAFIGNHYAASMVTLFESQLEQQFAEIDLSTVKPGATLTEMHSKALAGLGVIIGSQIARRLAIRLTQRIAGRIVGRVVGRAAASLIPVAGWVVGAGLIAWDLVEGADGALPQIQESFKSAEVKTDIKNEIIAVASSELAQELPKAAREVADNIFDTWIEFKKQYQNVLLLAAANPGFKAILEDVSSAELYKLSQLVALSLSTVGDQGLKAALNDGSFRRIFDMPAGALDILAATRSMTQVIAWSELAGPLLDKVAELEIYKLRTPEQLDKTALTAITALDDKAVVADLLVLDDEHIGALLSLPASHLQQLSEHFDAAQLQALGDYMLAMNAGPARNQLIGELLKRPQLITQLENPGLQKEIVASDNPAAIIDFVNTGAGLRNVFGDGLSLLEGTISLNLFWYKYGSVRNVVIVAIILALLLLYGMLRYRRQRPTPIIINVPSEKHKSD
jgi:hypothetical protein